MSSCICVEPSDSAPRVYGDSIVVARKKHICCECRAAIQPGQRYEVVKGLWDGWATYKTCEICAAVRDEYMACGSSFGKLWEHIHEAICLEGGVDEYGDVAYCLCPGRGDAGAGP